MTMWPAGWPRTPPGKRRRGAFTYKGQEGTYGDGSTRWAQKSITRAKAIDRVTDEVRRMGGAGTKIETFEHLRIDGQPRTNQDRDMDPGAVVSFRLGNRPFVFPCDRYTDLAQNLAAIAATIEAKRAIERHGVSTLEREFEGYAALPSGDPTADAAAASQQRQNRAWILDKVPPHQVLGIAEDAPIEVAEAAWKALAKKHHPDVGGDEGKAAEVNAAIAKIREAAG